MPDDLILRQIGAARDDEKRKREAHMTRARIEWRAGEGFAYKTRIGQMVKEALEQGHSWAAIGRAMGTSNFHTPREYAKVAGGETPREVAVDSVDSVKIEKINDREKLVHLKNYMIAGAPESGTIRVQQDEDGDWMVVTETDLGAAVNEELFFEDRKTLLTDTWAGAR